MSDKEGAPPATGPVAKILGLFAEVKPEEVVSVSLFFLTAFTLLFSYYLVKVVREPLVLQDGGAEIKSYASAGQALTLVVLNRVYKAVADRAPRLLLTRAVYGFFAAMTGGFGVLALLGARVGIPFYIYVGCFSLTVIAQFWSFANDVYTEEQGRRLFAMVGFGSSTGALLGSFVGGKLFPVIGPGGLMLSTAGLLLVCLALVSIVDRREGVAEAETKTEAKVEKQKAIGDDGTGTFDRYLWMAAVLMLLVNFVNSNGEYILDRVLLDAAHKELGDGANVEKFAAAFKSSYFVWFNGVGLALQLFVASRLLHKWGVRAAVLCLPIISLGSYATMLFFPVLAAIRLGKIAENSVDYSIQATSNQAMYLVVSRKQKFVAKNLIDGFFVRFGDICSAGLVFAGQRLALETKHFILANIALGVGWLSLAFVMGKENERRGGTEKAKAAA